MRITKFRHGFNGTKCHLEGIGKISNRYRSTLFFIYSGRFATALITESLGRQVLVGRYFHHHRLSKYSYFDNVGSTAEIIPGFSMGDSRHAVLVSIRGYQKLRRSSGF